ncbi:MAG TPA: ABC transporter ATP-binding protein [Blastocatellia bacterium]|nr:ABC transporter ATP-binding protein [Blastocatellia bacterium]
MIDIRFDKVSKKYLIRRERERRDSPRSLKARINGFRRRSEQFWALRDVSFEVKRSEALGIIGPNGAGKSTILKLLSNITTPTRGEITIRGRLSALIEVGSGFHPELTGRENVFLSGSILGMRRREISEKLESIIDFAEVRQFIDTPVKRYSSGMYVRLGFSIAAHLHPDVLLLDEVLAVGDAAFQAKCVKRITELKQNGTTIVFISHDLTSVELLCDRVLLLSQGEIAADGPPRDVINLYQQRCDGAPVSRQSVAGPEKEVEVTDFALFDGEGRQTNVLRTGKPLSARIKYTASHDISDVVFEVFFYSAGGKYHSQLSTNSDGSRIDLDKGTGSLEFFCPELGLQPGIYYVDSVIKRRGASLEIDWQSRCATLRVDPCKSVLGDFYMAHEWRLDSGFDPPVAKLGRVSGAEIDAHEPIERESL